MTEAKGKPEGAKAAPLSRLLAWSDRINGWSEKALFGLMLGMIFFTTLQIVCRVFFALSWSGSSPVSFWSMPP